MLDDNDINTRWDALRKSEVARLNIDEVSGALGAGGGLTLLKELAELVGQDPATAVPVATAGMAIGSIVNPYLGVALVCLVAICKLKEKKKAVSAKRADEMKWAAILNAVERTEETFMHSSGKTLEELRIGFLRLESRIGFLHEIDLKELSDLLIQSRGVKEAINTLTTELVQTRRENKQLQLRLRAIEEKLADSVLERSIVDDLVAGYRSQIREKDSTINELKEYIRELVAKLAERETDRSIATALRFEAKGDVDDAARKFDQIVLDDLQRGVENRLERMWFRARQEDWEGATEDAIWCLGNAQGDSREQVHNQITTLSVILLDLALWKNAESLCRYILSQTRSWWGSSHRCYAISLNHLARYCSETGDVDGAEKCLNESLNVVRKLYGEGCADESILLSNLAQLFQGRGQLLEAEEMMRASLQITLNECGEDSLDVALRLANFAPILMDLYRLTEAKFILERSIQIFIDRQEFLLDGMLLAKSNLSQVFYEKGEYDAALVLSNEIFDTISANFGPNHPRWIFHLVNHAHLLKQFENYEEAEKLALRALILGESIYQENHRLISQILSLLGQIYHDLLRYKEAESYMRRAISINEKLFNTNHGLVAREFNNFAILLQDTDRLEEAEPFACQALEISRKCFPPIHPEIAIQVSNVGQLYILKGDYLNADPLMKEQLFIFAAISLMQQSLHPLFKSAWINCESNLNRLYPSISVDLILHGILDDAAEACGYEKWPVATF